MLRRRPRKMFGSMQQQEEPVGQTQRFAGMFDKKRKKKPANRAQLKKMSDQRKVKQVGKKLGNIGRGSGMGKQMRTQRGIY